MTQDYVELHTHSAYSLLDGASMPAALVERAAELGMDALALTDHNGVYGAVPFVTAARAYGIQPILGAELSLADGHHLTLLVADQDGWRNLCTLISSAQSHAPKGQAALSWDELEQHTTGLIVLSGCRRGPVAAALRRWDRGAAFRTATWLRERFGRERCWIELQHHRHFGESTLLRDLVDLARHLRLGYVATNNVHYARRAGSSLYDLLTAIRRRTPLEISATRRDHNSEYYLKRGGQLLPLFRAYPDALTNTRRITEQCTFQLCYGLQDLPAFPTPLGLDASGYLRQLCLAALPQRYPGAPERVCRQLGYELQVIANACLSNYFLIVWDLVRFARQHRIRCQGRGSAANSLVAYLLGISPIDPLAHNLVFERFLSEERPVLPDIDIDVLSRELSNSQSVLWTWWMSLSLCGLPAGQGHKRAES
jgi:error-prone DNA polymerase